VVLALCDGLDAPDQTAVLASFIPFIVKDWFAPGLDIKYKFRTALVMVAPGAIVMFAYLTARSYLDRM